MIEFFDTIPTELYHDIYLIVLFLLCAIVVFSYCISPDNRNIVKDNPGSKLFAIGLSIIVILFIGLRPIKGSFIDMSLYAFTYNNFYDGLYGGTDDSRGEWFFYWIGNTCKRYGLIDREYFLVIASFYFGLMAAACWRLMRRNMLVAVLFCFVSFQCYTYGVNGMRNGMACSMAMFGITLLDGEKIKLAIAIGLLYLAYSTHHSTSLPSICALASLFVIKDTKWALFFWLASFFISTVAGNYIAEFFASLGFDDRMEQYANLDEFGEVQESINPKAGFRIDFLIYSSMPIIMVWYVTIKRHFKDKMYTIIANTYILANAFWVMVIRSNQSNRFAYLSWFIYPLVIAYPLLRMNIWEDQDRKTGLILLAYSGFSMFMYFFYDNL